MALYSKNVIDYLLAPVGIFTGIFDDSSDMSMVV